MKIGLVSPGIALIVLLFSTSLSAEVFRWVDENGKVHFGDRPPMGQKTETLDLPKGPDQSQAPLVSDEERKLRQRKLVKMLEEERLAKEQAKQEAAAEAKEKEQHCIRFKNRLAYLDRYTHIYNEREDGTRDYMSDEEMDAYRARVKEQYRQECGQD